MGWWLKVFRGLFKDSERIPVDDSDDVSIVSRLKDAEIKVKLGMVDWATGLNEELIIRVANMLEYCAIEGLRVDVFQGFRTYEEQDKLYLKGRRGRAKEKKVTNAKGGYSWHNFGLAVDIVFKPNKRWSWAESNPWDRLGLIGKKAGLEWGGDWKRFKDRPHFQLTGGMSMAEARRLRSIGGLEEVWKRLNQLLEK